MNKPSTATKPQKLPKTDFSRRVQTFSYLYLMSDGKLIQISKGIDSYKFVCLLNNNPVSLSLPLYKKYIENELIVLKKLHFLK